jgi:hypothetical protein
MIRGQIPGRFKDKYVFVRRRWGRKEIDIEEDVIITSVYDIKGSVKKM